MKRLLLSTAIVLCMFATSCTQEQKENDPLAETGRTQRTENLLTSLKELCAQDKFTPSSEEEACAQYLEKAEKHVTMLCNIAKKHVKAAAVTETSYEGLMKKLY